MATEIFPAKTFTTQDGAFPDTDAGRAEASRARSQRLKNLLAQAAKSPNFDFQQKDNIADVDANGNPVLPMDRNDRAAMKTYSEVHTNYGRK